MVTDSHITSLKLEVVGTATKHSHCKQSSAKQQDREINSSFLKSIQYELAEIFPISIHNIKVVECVCQSYIHGRGY